MKLVIIGGGSINTPAFFHALVPEDQQQINSIYLLDQSTETIELVRDYCARILAAKAITISVEAGSNPAEAFSNADIVLNMLRNGGLHGQAEDQLWLAASGIQGHAATYAAAMRNLPPAMELAKLLELTSPNALWLNFSNPVSILCEALAKITSLKVIGICYHSFMIKTDFAQMLNVHEHEIELNYHGINHLGWITDVRAGNHNMMEPIFNKIRHGKNKKYNYKLAGAGLIPIDHASSLYHSGAVWYDREKGIRGSLTDGLIKLGMIQPPATKETNQRELLLQLVKSGDITHPELFHQQAPWYQTCIVPFLRAYLGGKKSRFLLTCSNSISNQHQQPTSTAEVFVEIASQRMSILPHTKRLPEKEERWLNSVRTSEQLLIEAILQNSLPKAISALEIHPNVASHQHAMKFLTHYFEKDFAVV